MNEAKAAISQFTGKHGHKTEVDETVNPQVTQEAIKPTRHEEQTEAIDREVHQDHHHTTIQPISHQEVLPEQHRHQMGAVEERTFNHDDDKDTGMRLEKERGQFKDTSTTHATRETSSQAGAVMGEHVHHHVHETIQPVVNKETIAPEVIHTTKPVHELHQASAQVHGTSVLPTKTLSEFEGMGGNLKDAGRTGTTVESYDGVPRQYNQSMMKEPLEADMTPEKTGVDGPGSHHTGGTGLSAGEPFTDQREGHRIGHGSDTNNTASGLGQSGTNGTGSGMTSGMGRDKEYTNGQNTGMERLGNGQQSGGTDGLPNTNARPGADEYAGQGTSRQTGTTEGLGQNTHSGASGYQAEKDGVDTTTSGSGQKPSMMDKIKKAL